MTDNRSKCDETKPSCQNSKRICPGYRDLSKVRFGGKPMCRKESSPASEKRKRSRSASYDAALFTGFLADGGMRTENPMALRRFADDSINSRGGYHGSVMVAFLGHNSLSSMYLQVSEYEAAQCFFPANFILIPNTVTRMGHLNFIVPLLKTASEISPLRSAFSAVSLASFGAQPNSKDLLPQAKLNYVQALEQINVALANPKQAKGDSIAATTLLLTIYEVCAEPTVC
jgi:hypothetical protein